MKWDNVRILIRAIVVPVFVQVGAFTTSAQTSATKSVGFAHEAFPEVRRDYTVVIKGRRLGVRETFVRDGYRNAGFGTQIYIGRKGSFPLFWAIPSWTLKCRFEAFLIGVVTVVLAFAASFGLLIRRRRMNRAPVPAKAS